MVVMKIVQKIRIALLLPARIIFIHYPKIKLWTKSKISRNYTKSLPLFPVKKRIAEMPSSFFLSVINKCPDRLTNVLIIKKTSPHDILEFSFIETLLKLY
jgi:hypothetical protein